MQIFLKNYYIALTTYKRHNRTSHKDCSCEWTSVGMHRCKSGGCHIVEDVRAAFFTALGLLVGLDRDLVAIVCLSLSVSLSAVSLATVLGLPLGAAVAVWRFPGQAVVSILLNAMMGLPPVVVGLMVYLLLSRAGPLGPLSLLFTPTAMVIAQCLLVTPIIAAFTRQTVADLHEEYAEQLRSFGVGPGHTLWTLLWDGRFSLLTGILAGFGRASAEVGAVIIVGGNIHRVTRVVTTTIALETSKGNLPLALALGMILMLLVLAVNAAAVVIRDTAKRVYG
jgi:tungstate transport system permease protein